MENVEKRFARVKASKTFNNIVKTFKLNDKTVLDIGCSYGEFLINFGQGSMGITIIKEEAEIGNRKNLNIILGNIESAPINISEKFDYIFANNILEHLLSPHLFLVNAKKYLKPEGKLILGVPVLPTISFIVKWKKFRGALASAHMNFYNLKTLECTVKAAGWDIVTIRGFHFKNFFVDKLLNLIYPHFYVVAKPKTDFNYSPKRMEELKGYQNAFFNAHNI